MISREMKSQIVLRKHFSQEAIRLLWIELHICRQYVKELQLFQANSHSSINWSQREMAYYRFLDGKIIIKDVLQSWTLFPNFGSDNKINKRCPKKFTVIYFHFLLIFLDFISIACQFLTIVPDFHLPQYSGSLSLHLAIIAPVLMLVLLSLKVEFI